MPAETRSDKKGCPQVQDLILKLVANPSDLDQATLDRIDEHLAECPSCCDRLEEASRAGAQAVLSQANLPPPLGPKPMPQETTSLVQMADALGRGGFWAGLRPAWPSAAAIILCVGLVAVLGTNVARLSATAARLETENALKDTNIRTHQEAIHALKEERAKKDDALQVDQAKIRELEGKVDYFDYLQKQTQMLMTVGLITLPDTTGFSIVEPGRKSLRLVGGTNSAYIKEVRYRWGVEPEGEFTTLYSGGPKPDPQGKRVALEAVSPLLELNGDTVIATVEFVPYPEIKDRYPEFFTPAHTRYSCKFVLAKDGIRPDDKDAAPAADTRLISVLSPQANAQVSGQETLEGKITAAGLWPVVFIQPLMSGQPWWVQAPVEEVVEGHFTADVRIGDKTTKAGTKFRIAVVLAKSREEALKFQAGDTRLALPANLPHSEFVIVVRQ
jgi:hypothetical protein